MFKMPSALEVLVPFADGNPKERNVGATEKAIVELEATVPPFKHTLTVLVVPLPGYANENAPCVRAPEVREFPVVAEFDPL